MTVHNPQRVEYLRLAVAKHQRLASSISDAVSDSVFLQQLGLVQNWLNDVESFYLADLDKESRTAQQEALWLDHAERMLGLAVDQLNVLNNLFKEYGPTIRFISS